eukprot:g43148.t1
MTRSTMLFSLHRRVKLLGHNISQAQGPRNTHNQYYLTCHLTLQNTYDVVTNTAQKASQEVPRTMSLLNSEKIIFRGNPCENGNHTENFGYALLESDFLTDAIFLHEELFEVALETIFALSQRG